jgi:hypothetical protein
VGAVNRTTTQLTKTSFSTQSTALLLANVFGAVFYVFAASRGGWAIPEERAAGTYTVTGEPFVWFLNILPVIAIFFVINLVWGVRIITGRDRCGSLLWLLTAAIWIVAVIIDFAHH